MNSSEIYLISEGVRKLKISEDIQYLEKDDSAYILPNSKQFSENSGVIDLDFLCIAEAVWKQENEILLE